MFREPAYLMARSLQLLGWNFVARKHRIAVDTESVVVVVAAVPRVPPVNWPQLNGPGRGGAGTFSGRRLPKPYLPRLFTVAGATKPVEGE